MEKVCSSKHDAAFISSPPTEFVIIQKRCYFLLTFDRGSRSLGGRTYSSEVYCPAFDFKVGQQMSDF